MHIHTPTMFLFAVSGMQVDRWSMRLCWIVHVSVGRLQNECVRFMTLICALIFHCLLWALIHFSSNFAYIKCTFCIALATKKKKNPSRKELNDLICCLKVDAKWPSTEWKRKPIEWIELDPSSIHLLVRQHWHISTIFTHLFTRPLSLEQSESKSIHKRPGF